MTRIPGKLIFTNEELKLRFFLAKGPDVPTYVEYGAADIGIVGKDTILEEGRKLYEVMDLGFGACRMCVCGPESAREVLNNNQLIRVATKYPNIAKDYFYNKKHQTVEIIKLNGSIEPCTDRRSFRSHRGYRGNRKYPSREWSEGVGGSLPAVCPYGSQPGQHENGR